MTAPREPAAPAKTAVDAPSLPLDPISAAALAERGLEYVSVDPGEEGSEPFIRWSDAIGRGFLDERSKPESVEAWRKRCAGSRLVAVMDPGAPLADHPVATVRCWVGDLTVDVGRTLPTWAISAVTVSSTHRRRGIARALLEGELRAAAAAGLAMAGLTASEATIYGRYGFGPAAAATDWKIDTRRAGWVGPQPVRDGRGRIDIVERETVQADARELFDRVRLGRPGEMEPTDSYYIGLAGMFPGHPNLKVRAASYTDAEGALRGLLAYEPKENPDSFPDSSLRVQALIAETPDAEAALWHFALTHDLIGTVTASEFSTDEPLRWMVANQRALTVTQGDHHWLRILNIPAALTARGYRRAGSVILEVADPVGIAGGRFRLDVDAVSANANDDDDLSATVTELAAEPEVGQGEAASEGAGTTAGARAGVVRLGIAELSALYLGGVRAQTLLAAGRIETDSATAAWFDAAFAPLSTPRLSFWY